MKYKLYPNCKMCENHSSEENDTGYIKHHCNKYGKRVFPNFYADNDTIFADFDTEVHIIMPCRACIRLNIFEFIKEKYSYIISRIRHISNQDACHFCTEKNKCSTFQKKEKHSQVFMCEDFKGNKKFNKDDGGTT